MQSCPDCGRLICFDVAAGDDVIRPAAVTSSGDVYCDYHAAQHDRAEEEELDDDFNDLCAMEEELDDDFNDLCAMEAHELREALDLDAWTETSGFGSVDAIICPHCRAQFHQDGQVIGTEIAEGLVRCDHCQQLMVVRRLDSPVGQAWLTLAVPAAADET